MSLEDDMFNDNDTEMLDAHDEDDEEDEEEDISVKDHGDNDDEMANSGDDDEDDEEGDDDEEVEDAEGNPDEDDDDEVQGTVADETQYTDARESPLSVDERKPTVKGVDTVKDDIRERNELEKNEDEGMQELSESNDQLLGDDHKRDSAGSDNDGDEEQSFREKIVSQAQHATKFDIVPTVAIPYASQCHSIAFSEGPRLILTGGEDGFIRKYDFIASIEGKSPLTMAQKHNMVDTITKAGVIVSYWENEQPQTRKQILASNPKLKATDFTTGNANYEPKVCPVYAIDVDRNGFWCLSGLSKGGVSLYTMRYNEGAIHHYFMHGDRSNYNALQSGHCDTVSSIKLNSQEDRFLSGSWDKTIREWDLNSGACTNVFLGSTGQISNIQYRPRGLADFLVIVEDDESGSKPRAGDRSRDMGSDMESLFGESDDEEVSRVKLESSDKSSPAPQVDSVSKIENKKYTDDSIFMSSSIDGTINIWDVRCSNQNGNNSVIRLGVPEGTPPWCMSSTWSNCGEFIYAGRRNSTVEEISIKMPHKRSTAGQLKGAVRPNVLKTLNFPKISGPISSIATMPNRDFLLCGSNDNIRLYNLSLYNGIENSNISTKGKPATPFMIIPGHHGGILSALWLDDTGRFMVSASGNRGWGHANYTETVLLYEIDFE